MILTKNSSLLLIVISILTCSFAWGQQSTPPDSIDYCIDPAWAPYESMVNNQHVGISKQYLDIISSLSSIKFNLIATKDWNQTLAFAKAEKCQMIPMLNTSSERQQYLTFSNAYFHAPNALYGHYNQTIVGNLSSITTQTVAVVSGYRMHDYLKRTFPDMNIVEVATEKEGLIEVENQQIDYFVGSFYAANKIIHDLSLAQLRIVGIAELEDELRIGVTNSVAEHILPRLNDAIAQLTNKHHQQVFRYLTSINTIKKTDYSVAIKAGLIFIVVTTLLAIGYWRKVLHSRILFEKNNALKKLHQQLDAKNQQLAELAIRDPLTNLYNRSHLAEMIQQQIKVKNRYQTDACMIMIDVDDFKHINDNFGHQLGDTILIKIANVLVDCARDADIAARWGGEEFVLLCPQTSLDEAVQLATRFQSSLSDIKSDALPNVTCSIGIAELQSKNTADEWFICADNAMYQAKRQGKNAISTVEK